MKRVLIAGAVLLGFGALSTPVEAQSGSARGKVIDSQRKGCARGHRGGGVQG